jgi:DNA-binding NarL/FixJ family response regulator
LYSESGDQQGMAGCARDLASVAALTGQHEQAVHLFGASEALREAIGAWAIGAPTPRQPARYEQAVAEASAGLGDEAFSAAWEAGRAMPLEDAFTTALAVISQAAARPTPAPIARFGLTPRELEILRFVAGGSSNLEIAETLFISVPTVKRHLTNILGKLEVTSRTDAAAFARAHGFD